MRWPAPGIITSPLLAVLVVGALAGPACTPACPPHESAWESDTRAIDALRAAGRYDEALARSRSVSAQLERDPHSPDWLLSDARRRTATLEQVLALGSDARAQLARADQLILSAAAASDSGRALLSVEQSAEAVSIRTQILGARHFETGAALSRSGGYLRDLGDYVAAERSFMQADSILRSVAGLDHPQVADNLMGLGLLRRLQREPEVALEYTQSALDSYARTLGCGTLVYAQALIAHAGALRETPRRLEARSLYEEAIAVIGGIKGDQSLEYASALHSFGNYHMRLKDFGGAERLMRRGLDIRRARLAPTHPLLAWSFHDLGMALLSQQRLEEAIECFRASLRIRKIAYGPEHPLLIEDLRHLPRLAMNLGRYAEAETLIIEAIRAYEIVRRHAGTGLRQDLFFSPPYDQLAVLRLLQGREREAWVATELAQSRGLTSLLLAGEKDPRASSGAARGRPPSEPRDRRLAQWDEVVLPGPQPVTIQAIHGSAFDPRQVQAELPPGSALVGWITAPLADERNVLAYGYVVLPRGPVHWVKLPETVGGPNPYSLAVEVTDGLRAAAAWPAHVGDDRHLAAQLRHLWACCFRPLEVHLRDVRELIVIPNYLFLGLPVEALIDSTDAPIADRWNVSYVPSATAYTWLHRSSPPPGARNTGPALLIGDPPPDAVAAGRTTGGPLPGARKGLETIAALLPQAVTMLGPAASEESLHALAATGQLERYRIVVFATHAITDPGSIEHCALALAPSRAAPRRSDSGPMGAVPGAAGAADAHDPGEDGLLTAGEISSYYRFDADLVWLAGCGTGLGRRFSHEGYLGLASAFLLAGARSLVVSLWPVDDEAAGLLTTRYFQNLTSGERAGGRGAYGVATSQTEALSEARQWLRAYANERGERIYAHPVYWAGFVLIGNPD